MQTVHWGPSAEDFTDMLERIIAEKKKNPAFAS